MSRRINDVGPDFTAETTQRLVHFSRVDRHGMRNSYIGILSSNNPKNPRISLRMHVSRLGGNHLADCDDKGTRREK